MCCIKKDGRLCISQVDKQQNPNKILGEKKIKAGKVAKKKLKKPKKSKRKVINENKGSGITFKLVRHNNWLWLY